MRRLPAPWHSLVPIALVVALTAAVYAPSLTGPFVYDDERFVVQNISLRQISLWPSYFTDYQTLAASDLARDNYRPLLTLSFAVDYAVWGLNPLGYHLTNLFWHLVNVLLLYGLFLALGLGSGATLLGVTLFALHPIQTEAVSWVSGRADVLFLAGTIGAFWAFIASREARAPRRQLLYGLSLVAYLAGQFSKEMAATLPLLLVVWLLFRRRRSDLPSTLPFFLIFAGYFSARTLVLGRIAQTDYGAGSFLATQLTMVRGVAVYLKRLAFPLNLSLEHFIPYAHSPLDAGCSGVLWCWLCPS